MTPRQASEWKPGPSPCHTRAVVWSYTSAGWFRVGGDDSYEAAVMDAETRMSRARNGVKPTKTYPRGITPHPEARFVATWEYQEPDDAWAEL